MRQHDTPPPRGRVHKRTRRQTRDELAGPERQRASGGLIGTLMPSWLRVKDLALALEEPPERQEANSGAYDVY